jgi:hypothetical protein
VDREAVNKAARAANRLTTRKYLHAKALRQHDRKHGGTKGDTMKRQTVTRSGQPTGRKRGPRTADDTQAAESRRADRPVRACRPLSPTDAEVH